ncbi:MAG: radical SAM protein, partial [Desulfobacterales bacterium]|nr:radical SAM protein [Desulfobacterales bacterium]
MYRYLFGPVPSRRLGISLGIDLVPMKTCTLDCIYCECGRTTGLTLERAEYVPLETVKEEYRHYLAHNPAPDYITFSGSGEPTLNRHIGEIIRFIQARDQQVPVAVLTNGTLLGDPGVRAELKEASVVIPSLDAAT